MRSIQWKQLGSSLEDAPPYSGSLVLTGSLTVSGSINLNNSLVGDVRTSQSYSNPTWITSLAWTKITSTPTTLAGYGIVDAQPLLTNPVTGTGTAGQLAFWNGTTAQTGSNTLIWDNSTQKILLAKSGFESQQSEIYVDTDTSNTNVRALYIVPPANSNRIFFGRSGKTAYSLNLSNVSNLEGVPAFMTADSTVFGGNGSFSVFRNGDMMLFNASSPSVGGFRWFITNSYSNTTSSTERMRLFDTGNLLLQNGGTYTDAGFRLDVNGTARIVSTLEIDTIDNGTGDFATISPAGVITRRTPAQTLDDIGASSVTQVTGVVVPSGSFNLVTGFYEASIANAGILETSIVDIIPTTGSYTVVKNAEFLPETDSSTGSVKVYCVNAPASDITVTLNIVNT